MGYVQRFLFLRDVQVLCEWLRDTAKTPEHRLYWLSQANKWESLRYNL